MTNVSAPQFVLMSVVIVLQCATVLFAAPSSENLLRNGDCDQVTAQGAPAVWTYSYSSAGTCEFVADRQIKRTGDSSIRLSNHQGGAKFPRMFQSLTLQADTSYTLTAWVRSTSAAANMNVTPGDKTWYGIRDISTGIGIGVDTPWRQIQLRFSTGKTGRVNVVFTLETPDRQAGDLWIDDVRLVAANAGPSPPTKPDMAEFTPPIDASVELPHVDWATPLSDPRPRVLFIAPAITIRDVIELAHRMDVEAGFCYAPGDHVATDTSQLLDLFEQPWDAIVLASVDWSRFDTPARDALWSAVHGGTGLFLVKPLNADASLNAVTGALSPSSMRVFFSDVQQLDMPYLSWVRAGANLRVGQVGTGRIAWLDYAIGDHEQWGQRVCSLFPPHPGRVPRADEMPWWEPCFAMLARATLWTAGAVRSEVTDITDITVDTVTRDGVTVHVTVEDVPPGVMVRAVCIGPGNQRVAEATAPIDAQAGIASIALNAPLLTGDHFVWAWAQRDDGTVIDWGAGLFRAPGPTLDVTTDRERYELGDVINGTVRVESNDQPGEIEMSLVDGFGRMVDRTVVAAGETSSFQLSTADVRSLTARVVARLMHDVNGTLRVACEADHVVPVAREMDDEDYLVGIWSSYYELTCSRPWSHHLVQYQRDMGVDFAYMSHSQAEDYFQTYAEHDMWPLPGELYRIWFKEREPFISLNLADPDFEPTYRQRIVERAATGYRWGAYDYSIGDECGYALRYNETTYVAFRRWLQNRYDNLAHLNRAWGTDFPTWNDVVPLRPAELDRAVSIAPDLEFRTFSDDLFIDAIDLAGNLVRDSDSRNRIGIDGTRDPGHYIGYDWYKLMQVNTHLSFYDGIQREVIRSFAKPGDMITSWVGYDFYDLDERNARYFPWLELFNGFQGISMYSASSSTWHGYAHHDLSLTRRARWVMDELDELKTGVGRAILTAERDPSPIAVLYSQRSLHAAGAPLWRDNVTGVCETIKDLGLQFDFVADAQLTAGVLENHDYRVLILPLAVALTDDEAAAIERYAHEGGRVIAIGEAGVFDQFGTTRDKAALDDLFGVTTPPTVTQREQATAHLFDVKLSVVPRSVVIDDGEGRFEQLDLRPYIRRPVGDGEAILFNFLWTGYRSFRSGGVGGEVTHRTSADAQTAGAFWHVMEAMLADKQIEPPAVVTQDGKPLRYIEQVVYRRGPITYLGLMPRYFGGRYTQATDRILIQPDDFTSVQIAPQSSGYVHDVRARKSMGRLQTIDAHITDGVALLYAFTPYDITGLALDAPQTASLGDTLEIAVNIATTAEPAGDHVVHLHLVDPDGNAVPWGRYNLLTDSGAGVWRTRLPLNAGPGTWRIEAHELISGHKATAEIAVGPRLDHERTGARRLE